MGVRVAVAEEEDPDWRSCISLPIVRTDVTYAAKLSFPGAI